MVQSVLGTERTVTSCSSPRTIKVKQGNNGGICNSVVMMRKVTHFRLEIIASVEIRILFPQNVDWRRTPILRLDGVHTENIQPGIRRRPRPNMA